MKCTSGYLVFHMQPFYSFRELLFFPPVESRLRYVQMYSFNKTVKGEEYQ